MKHLIMPLNLLLLLALFVAMRTAQGQERRRQPAVDVEPIAGILQAFESYPIVALGEGSHGNEQSHRFRLALISDPRFAATVNDIVVESGSARYQDVMDRFIRGEDVPYDVFTHAWRHNTT
jgi:erythromycin esterase-like protein